MSLPWKKYRKSFSHSYAFGVYPTLELLSSRPQLVRQVLLFTPAKGGAGIQMIFEQCRRYGIPTRTCPRTIRRLGRREYPVVVVFDKFTAPIRHDVNHVVLYRPAYNRNVGAIIRTMVGFGLADLAVIGDGVDMMNPSLIRASMGATFRLRWEPFENLHAYRKAFPSRECYCFKPDGELSVEDITPRGAVSFVFGSEGEGLPSEARELGVTVRIAHRQTIDSLNLGVAVGIALHEIVHRL